MIGASRIAALRGRLCGGVVARNYAALVRRPVAGQQPLARPLVASFASNSRFGADKRKKSQPVGDDGRTIEELASSIDTTLTAEQQAYVDKLKRKMKGSGKKRCKLLQQSSVHAPAFRTRTPPILLPIL